MRRITLSLDDELADAFDAWAERHAYTTRSEAFRDLLRGRLDEETIAAGGTQDCAIAVSFVYDHHERQLASRLADAQHAHHDICLSTLHVHLDPERCLETTVLRGPLDTTVRFAEELIAERGVRLGKILIVPLEEAAPAAVVAPSRAGKASVQGEISRYTPAHAHLHPHAGSHSHAHPHAPEPTLARGTPSASVNDDAHAPRSARRAVPR